LFRRLGRMWWHAPPSENTLRQLSQHMIYRSEADAHFLIDGARWDGRPLAGQVRAPTLVVSGASDRTFPPAQSRQLAEMLPHGTFVEIPAAGHLPFVEQPDRFIAAVERFLSVHGRAE
jgi:pimeloyl-ACP methyl ester carboxylesterase